MRAFRDVLARFAELDRLVDVVWCVRRIVYEYDKNEYDASGDERYRIARHDAETSARRIEQHLSMCILRSICVCVRERYVVALSIDVRQRKPTKQSTTVGAVVVRNATRRCVCDGEGNDGGSGFS